MKHWKQYIPIGLKRKVRQGLRRISDITHGYSGKFSNGYRYNGTLYPVIHIQQHVHLTASSKNKLHNLQMAIKELDNASLRPGEIFSFWKLVGEPTIKKGYLPSRSLSGGNLEATVGGGLCQLSGLLYYLALQSGLRILERHAHSVDIYTEAERFTPLGSDATVTYGYKDLRFINTSAHVMHFNFSATNEMLYGSLLASGTVEQTLVHFEYERREGQVSVKTYRDESGQVKVIDTSVYKVWGE